MIIGDHTDITRALVRSARAQERIAVALERLLALEAERRERITGQTALVRAALDAVEIDAPDADLQLARARASIEAALSGRDA